MATENLQVRITAELSQIRAGLQTLQTQLEQTRRSGQGVGRGASEGIQQLNTSLGRAGRIAAGFAASIGAAMSVAGLIRAADEAANISAKLRLATKDAREFQVAQRGTYELAQRTRTSLNATVDLYARIERSTRGIGVNQRTQLQLAENINKAAQISGGGQGAEAALFQLSQGLASGQLRGEELNSVLEQTPRLAQAIADGMNIPIGALRKYAEEGKLSANEVLKALLSQTETLNREFAQMPVTFSGGMTMIRNAFVDMLQTSPLVAGAVRGIGTAMQFIATNLPTIVALFAGLGTTIALAFAASKWSAFVVFIQALPALLGRVWAVLLANPLTALAALFAGVTVAIIGMRDQIKLGSQDSTTLGNLMTATWNSIKRGASEMGDLIASVFSDTRQDAASTANSTTKSAAAGVKNQEAWWLRLVRSVAQFFDMIGGSYRGLMRGLYNATVAGVGAIKSVFLDLAKTASAAMKFDWDAVKANGANALADAKGAGGKIGAAFGAGMREEVLNQAGGGLEALLDARIKEARALAAKSGKADATATGKIGIPGGGGTADPKKKKKSSDGKSAAEVAASLAQTNAELVQDAVRRSIEELDRLYEAGKISVRDYFAEKQKLELQSVDAGIAAAEADVKAAKGTEEVAAANAKLTQLLRDRAEIGPRAAREQAKAEKELTEQLGALKIRMLEAEGKSGEAARMALEQEFSALMAKLRANGDTEGLALAQRVINVEAWRGQLEQVNGVVQNAVSQFQSVQTASASMVDAGMMSQSDAEARIQEQRTASLEILVKQREELMAIAEAARLAGDALTMDAANKALTETNGKIAEMSINTQSLGYKAAQVLQGALTQLFMDLADSSKTAGEALRDFVLNFVKGMAQIAANALATFLVLQLLDAIYPGLGKTTAAMMGAGAKHSGGMASDMATRRQLPAFMFAAAPRFHSGGIAGLGPDEVPAVLKKNEEVLTAQDPRHRNNGGLGGGREAVVKTPVVAIGDRAVADALAGAAGEDVILTHVRNNWEGLTRAGG